MTFRSQLKQFLNERDMSQREFASRCGKSPAWASRILKGSLDLKSLDEVLRICEILELGEEDATNLCHAYQELETSTAYEIILRSRRAGAECDLLIIDKGIDIEAWKQQGRPTIRGEFAVVGRGARQGITPESFEQFNQLLSHLFEKGSVSLEDLRVLEGDGSFSAPDERASS